MNIVFYSDQKYVENALTVFKNVAEFDNVERVYYFTVDFFLSEATEYKHEKLFPIYINFDAKFKNLILYKPCIIKESLRFLGEEFLYIDTDILVANKFKDFEFPESSLPTSPYHYWEFPRMIDEMRIYTEDYLMEYTKVEGRTMHYLQACVIAYTRKHTAFIEEFYELCSDANINGEEDKLFYFPADDETAYNVLLWKYGATEHMGRNCIVANYTNLDWLQTISAVENNEQIDFLDYNNYTNSFSTENIFFYHGIKDVETLKNSQLWLATKTEKTS